MHWQAHISQRPLGGMASVVSQARSCARVDDEANGAAADSRCQDHCEDLWPSCRCAIRHGYQVCHLYVGSAWMHFARRKSTFAGGTHGYSVVSRSGAARGAAVPMSVMCA